MIPKVFHRIFLDDPIPLKFEAFWDTFMVLHPDWEFLTWNDSSKLGWMRNQEAFASVTTHAGRSDILRYEILAKYGGIYVDTDVEPLRSFEELVYDDRAFAGWENQTLLCPTVLGAPPGHPAFESLLSHLPAWIERHPDQPPNKQTGPHFLTRMWFFRDDVRRLSPVYFYPVGWWERDKLGGPYPEESFCVHHWNQGWDPEAKARIDSRQ